jgi:hypothetical protein
LANDLSFASRKRIAAKVAVMIVFVNKRFAFLALWHFYSMGVCLLGMDLFNQSFPSPKVIKLFRHIIIGRIGKVKFRTAMLAIFAVGVPGDNVRTMQTLPVNARKDTLAVGKFPFFLRHVHGLVLLLYW